MTPRPILEVPTPPDGWLYPWANVGQIATHLGPEDWTLVGGLMVALHATARGVHLPRTTVDVDMVVHVETARGRVAHIGRVLGDLGYTLMEPSDARKGLAHRFIRPANAGDTAMTGSPDIVDVMIADHPAPRVRERLGRFPMVAIDGGTQALQRTVKARLEITGTRIEVSVPDVLGAVILKSAAHLADSSHPAWVALDADAARDGQAALRILLG